ncbi:MAG: superoxide dismutase family protein [Alphaproteobacteria bacterium]|jgi:superoxide dismutase, Cu-Zn family|nr:superoxide dismutase family protein [Alphaproteobacteria bacterium]MBU1548195.1 superoxide dismutase family protein [Alphaproteobacteria bacterium]MBU2336043.1 superoxide dismutase family protein [Alphaproteobacteria bacterium]MBU2390562.1 superoxide dismutase family protein [Alphaproteobacteria bacterium]MDY6962164.1 superoxide dismutase family protein [Pseudomonadota bacterium]|tara:strand:+ start:836 stop:1345 length:510 start_codon:yes stop_codon:yes gene_type:complete
MKLLASTMIASALFGGIAMAQDATTATASFVGADGSENGNATLTEAPGGVLIEVEVSGLPASQWVAFHVHETGSCDHTTGHESAGGHFNPGDKEHGYKSANGPHAGDMPNQYVGTDGTMRAQVLNTSVTLDDAENGIQGKALMVHAGADDYESQPSGDAGERLACGVIE